MDENRNPSQKSGGTKVFAAIIIAIVLIVGIALAVNTLVRHHNNDTSNRITTSSEDSIEIGKSKEYSDTNKEGTLSTVEIAEKVKPSVIAVVVYAPNGEKYGEGSGVVMSTNQEKNVTYILTCAHIVDTPKTTLKVQIEDGTQYDATLVGYDERTDVGVVSIKGTALTPAEFGDSTVLKVGEPVYAIGNPGGTTFYGSMTDGIISAIDRPTASNENGYSMVCIQHSAPISPGNSGGALVNSYGQVIGINSSKIAADDYEGIGFAIPTAVAKNVVDDILSNGYVQGRAKLGISYISINDNTTYAYIAEKNKLPQGSIVIADMESDSAISGTKAQAGDIIVAVNGEELTDEDVLLEVIEESKPGDKLTLKIAHVESDYSVKTFDVTATLGEDKGSYSDDNGAADSNEDRFVNPFKDN